MHILVKCLFDEYGCKEYVFYESGKFAKPLFVLAEGFAERLKNNLIEIINDKDYRIKEINPCKK